MTELPKDFDYKKYPILIVDDDRAFLKAFVDDFSANFTVLKAGDAKTGIKIINECEDIAVVLADQRMPEVTGVQMLAQLKTQYPFITRILITAYADIEAAIDAINIGDIFKYISKPYKFEEVKQIIQRGIERYYFSKHRRRLQQEEIERLRQDISAESISILNTLTFELSHHLQNKLSAAVAFFSVLPEKLNQLIQNMREGMDKEYWYNYAKSAEAGIKNAVEIISDLFTYANMKDFKFSEADIIKIIEAEKEILRSLAKGKGIDFHFDLPESLPLIKLDAYKISQALENIVLNAIQAISQKGKIKVSARQHNNDIIISVVDDGVGIKRENIKKIFYPFFTTKGPQVRGLGLSVADTFVRLHSGRIEVRSEPNKGTTVNIKLPITVQK